ncbi:MAG: hypothetical protein AAF914_12330 [Pseudomonadota bacterium]
MSIRKFALCVIAALTLAGCAAEEVWAPDDVVARAAYTFDGPSTVTLLTMISNRNGAGGHSALLIDGSQRVLYDPAGSWRHPDIPERNDVLFGMSPAYLDFYMDYHARETFHVVVQTVEVSRATADALIANVQAQGAAAPAYCARSISAALSRTPGFETVGQSFFPRSVLADFGALPGVTTTQVFDDDSDDNVELLIAQARQRALQDTVDTVLGN